ncbi:hypothetical protein [Agrobacterium salinitolerans]|uniref:hypothetical protein n=1 Tax=Agrobacterium salinitolerans TaxID=1183413 RepID=UPI0035B2F209
MPRQTGIYDAVYMIEKPLEAQGWRIQIDSCLRLLKPSATFRVRFLQNGHMSVFSVKNHISRRWGTTATVEEESFDGLLCDVTFRIHRETFTKKEWTFGVLTLGKKSEIVQRFVKSIREFGGPSHQIIVCGPHDEALDDYDVEYITTQYRADLAEICRKKNDIVKKAQHDNICLTHDRYWLNEDFFTGFDIFGYDFEFVTVKQVHESGKLYPSYCSIDDGGNLVWGRISSVLDQGRSFVSHYMNGGMIVAKRQVLLDVPFNETLFHNQAEDVELAHELAARKILPRYNMFSSATTDVADHLTDAFDVNPAALQAHGSLVPQPVSPAPAVAEVEHTQIQPAPKKKLLKRIREKTRPARRKIKALFKKKKVDQPLPAPTPPAGFNLLVHASAAGGVLNVAMHQARMLERSNTPFSIVDIGRWDVPLAIPEDLRRYMADSPVYADNIWHEGFPHFPNQAARWPNFFEGRKNIMFTHWELPKIPERLHHCFELADEIMVDSKFVEDAVRTATGKPIRFCDLDLQFPDEFGAAYGREYFGIPGDSFVFLLNWEFTSSTRRKNPHAALDAFSKAFSGQPGVKLAIHVKCEDMHGSSVAAEFRKFQFEIERDYPSVIFIDRQNLSYEQAIGLKKACDCYVSLHRSEGYGLGCAEAVALGRDCIMTGWSGNMALMARPEWRKLIRPVSCKLVPVSVDDYPWVAPGEEGFQVWAEPSLEDATEAMRETFEKRSQLQSLAGGA